MDEFIKMLKEKGIYDNLQICVNETAALTKTNDLKAIEMGVAETLPLILANDNELLDVFIKDGCSMVAKKLNFQVTENLNRKAVIEELFMGAKIKKVLNKIEKVLDKISKKDEDKE